MNICRFRKFISNGSFSIITMEEKRMTVVKVIELIGSSPDSWEKAAQNAIDIASKSIRGIKGIDVVHFTAKVENGKIVSYKTNLKIAFKYEA